MKRVIKIMTLLICFFMTSACFKRDNFEGINIHTTVYPLEYITNRLYGMHSTVSSIYPSGVDTKTYEFTEKQIKDYSKTDLFIFNGLSSEKEYVTKFFDLNKNLKIIDSSSSMEYTYYTEELWLDPSNFLMLAQNIRYGLKEYINNHYLKNEIDENYNELKEEISKLDADMYEISADIPNKIIVVSSDLFEYLEKYDLNVISLEENDKLTEKTIVEVTDLINNNQVHYIFMKQGEETSETIQKLVDATDVELVYFHTLNNLSGEERNEKKDYISIMYDNIDLLKNELYD